MIALKALFLLLPVLAVASPIDAIKRQDEGSGAEDNSAPTIPATPTSIADPTIPTTPSISTSSTSSAASTTVLDTVSPIADPSISATPTISTSSTANGSSVTQIVSPTPNKHQRAGFLIRSNRDNKCLHATSSKGWSDGREVTTADCDHEATSTWYIKEGSGSVILAQDPRFALDAGEWPGNGGKLKIWTSYPGLMQQTWYLTGDKRIAITGGSQCLDESEKGTPQTWQCTDYNTNQIWFVEDAYTQGPYVDKQIRANAVGDGNKCVTVMENNAKEGAAVQITGCFDNEWSKMQRWDFLPGQQANHVKLHSNPDLCLTADKTKPVIVTLQKCEQGKVGQLWTHYGNELKLKDSDQCLDVKRESTGGSSQPYDFKSELQTWSCGNPFNPQQHFLVSAQ